MDTIVTETYHCDVSIGRIARSAYWMDAIVTFQDGADLEPTERQPLFSISRAWNMHRIPTKTESQRLN